MSYLQASSPQFGADTYIFTINIGVTILHLLLNQRPDSVEMQCALR